jgi:hypothetical protein
MLLIVTPLLGASRNFVKYKQFKPLVFFRTPIIYCFLYLILQTRNIWKILVLERWLMFIYKTSISVYRNDYQLKKEKYKKKYNLKYHL